MPTIVTYNGIEMHSVSTLRFSQVPVYDPSNTDVLYSRFTLSFEGLLHAGGDHAGAPVWIDLENAGGNFPAVGDAYRTLMTTLWTPRQKLEVDMGGQVIFQCSGPGQSAQFFDLDNGPKPKNVELSHISSNSAIGPTFRVKFEIECARNCCPDGTVQPVLDNRWAIMEGFDDEYFTTRTIQGRIRVSDATLPIDAYRPIIVPTLEKGFKRVRLDYNISANSLDVDYVVVDKQVHTAAPWPVAKINVRHTEGTANGAMFESECHVQLKGHPGASKIQMFAIGARILEDRLGKIQDMGKNNASVPVAMSMTDITGERNEIELFLKVQSSLVGANGVDPITNPTNFCALPVGSLGRPLGSMLPITEGDGNYNPVISTPPALWGYNSQGGDDGRQSGILLLLLECYLQMPCSTTHDVGEGRKVSVQEYSNSSTTVSQNSTLENWDDSFSVPNLESKETQKAIYTFCAAPTSVGVDPLRVGLPIAAKPANYSAGKDTCVDITLGWTQAAMTFHFECERVGQWPTIPEPIAQWSIGGQPVYSVNGFSNTGGINGSLRSAKIIPLPATVDATTTKKIYHVSCEYVYKLNRPPTRSETIPVGVLPFTNFKPADNALQLNNCYGGANQNTFISSGAPTNAGGY